MNLWIRLKDLTQQRNYCYYYKNLIPCVCIQITLLFWDGHGGQYVVYILSCLLGLTDAIKRTVLNGKWSYTLRDWTWRRNSSAKWFKQHLWKQNKWLTVNNNFHHSWTQIAKFMGPTWGPPGSCRPQMGPMLAPWTLLSGKRFANDLHTWLCEDPIQGKPGNILYSIVTFNCGLANPS